jgi:Subtilase family
MPTDDKGTSEPRRAPVRSQLIVTLKSGTTDFSPVERTVKSLGATLTPLFGNREALNRRAAALHERRADAPDLSRFYQVTAREEDYDRISRELRALDIVSSVYRKPAADAPYFAPAPAVEYSCEETACCTCGWAPEETPDFSARQRYFGAAPGGVDARYAWQRGAKGQGVEIVDIEREWRFDHQDIVGAPGVGLIGGTPADCLRERNHGTAVLGMLVGTENGRGVIGLCPQAHVRGYSTRTSGVPANQIPGTAETSKAIFEATRALTNDYSDLTTGHILLLELQRVGPGGYNIPVEWWWDDFIVIRDATLLGLIVVSAAGNGHPLTFVGANLDDPIYDTPLPEFDPEWKNPFKWDAATNARVTDSGSILVGAGAPPIGTPRADRSRLRYSNYGNCVDTQGWGQEVVTTGYGCLQGGPDEKKWYMGEFGGTSAASAMIAGVLGCVQAYRRARSGAPRLSAVEARWLLRRYGSPQVADGPQYPVSQRIGSRPDLRQLIP